MTVKRSVFIEPERLLQVVTGVIGRFSANGMRNFIPKEAIGSACQDEQSLEGMMHLKCL